MARIRGLHPALCGSAPWLASRIRGSAPWLASARPLELVAPVPRGVARIPCCVAPLPCRRGSGPSKVPPLATGPAESRVWLASLPRSRGMARIPRQIAVAEIGLEIDGSRWLSMALDGDQWWCSGGTKRGSYPCRDRGLWLVSPSAAQGPWLVSCPRSRLRAVPASRHRLLGASVGGLPTC